MRRKQAHVEEEHENSERWLLTYADLITLLLGVFVVLYATAEQDTSKFKMAMSAMAEVFNPSERTLSGPGIGLGNMMDACLANASSIQCQLQQQEQQRKVETLESVQKSLSDEEEKGLGKGLSTEMTEDGLVISVEEQLLFASGKTDFRPGATAVLARLASHLKKVSNPIQINGHTDNVPIHTPQFPSNWHLSSARAIKTAEFLIITEKLPMQRIHVAGYAETAPAADNATESGRAKNRRVELLLIKGHGGEAVPAPAPAAKSAGEEKGHGER
ncbi:MAG TPA: OmpA family protein [Elusimicrobiales bacterium]|nr:OmpA family protein [Elusimicrobiales bacterium]